MEVTQVAACVLCLISTLLLFFLLVLLVMHCSPRWLLRCSVSLLQLAVSPDGTGACVPDVCCVAAVLITFVYDSSLLDNKHSKQCGVCVCHSVRYTGDCTTAHYVARCEDHKRHTVAGQAGRVVHLGKFMRQRA